MPDGHNALVTRLIGRIDTIDAASWDACAGSDNPFVSHAFLKALEDSGSATARTGWLPCHLVVSDAVGRVVGAAPLYRKSHSWGEYVFDHGWADAYGRAGGRYYPKLQAAVPFTPVTGPRLLVRPEADGDAVVPVLIAAMEAMVQRLGVSSVHVSFPTEVEWRRLGAAGWLLRTGQQFHWENRGYAGFDDFLDALNARKRKAIRKERRVVADSGVRLHTLTGADLKPEHWDAFHRFYLDTVDRKWGQAYLTRDFFHRLGAVLGDRVVLILAEDNGQWVAGAFNLIGADTLYGRNWGAIGDYPFLHFEACYYRAIDFAIQRGLKRVEAGAQGEHKVQRGYLPVPTYSAHWIGDPGFRRAVAAFLERERVQVEHGMAALCAESPFRREE